MLFSGLRLEVHGSLTGEGDRRRADVFCSLNKGFVWRKFRKKQRNALISPNVGGGEAGHRVQDNLNEKQIWLSSRLFLKSTICIDRNAVRAKTAQSLNDLVYLAAAKASDLTMMLWGKAA